MKLKKTAVLLLAGVLAAGMTGCGSAGNAAPASGQAAEAGSSSGAEGGAGSTDEVKIGVLMKTMSDTYSNKLGTSIETYTEPAVPMPTRFWRTA